MLAGVALGGNGKVHPGAPLGPDSALPDAHEHPSKPDPEQGVAAVVQHSSGCQRLHLLLPNSFVCLISERDLPQWDLVPRTPDFLQNPMNSTLASLKIPD